MYFCVVCCDFSIFISNFVDCILLPFFLMSLANGLSILFILSKNQLLALLIFALFSFVYFCPNFYDLFPSPNHRVLLLFFSPFLVALDVELGYLFDFSLISWGNLVLLWTFPLTLLLLNPISLGLLCFHFYLFLCIFWFPLWFLLWFVSYSEACCLACICWNF